MTKKLVVIDGKSIFYRGYYAMPGLKTKGGIPTGGVYGFVSLSIEIIKKINPDYVAVAWDKAKTNIRKRKAIYAEYKAGRKIAPPDFYEQIPILKELLLAFGWPLYELDDYEADDIMGAFAKEATAKGIETDLVTSDLDSLQLVGPLTKVYAIKKGLSSIEEFDVAYFEKKYGIKINQYLDLKSLKGDNSDNLPGVAGIGEKTATQLLNSWGDLDNIYNHLNEIKPIIANKLKNGRDSAYMTKELARIWTEAPVKLDWDVADINDINYPAIVAILKKLEFTSLINRLPKYMNNVSLFENYSESNENNWDDKSILSSDKIIIINRNKDLIVSTNEGSFSRKKIEQVDNQLLDIFLKKYIICLDGKDLYHFFDKNNLNLNIPNIYDVQQADFLLFQTNESVENLNDGQLIKYIWNKYNSQQKLFKDEHRLFEVAKILDFPLIKILFKMEKHGIKINKKVINDINIEISDKIKETEQRIYNTVGYEFNVGSPQQLSHALFDVLGLSTNGIKKNKTYYSTNQKSLTKLKGSHLIINLIESIRELAKVKNTYVDVLPNIADSESIIHTTFNQNVTATGRLSSTNPNIQNIPVRGNFGKRIREAFIPNKEGNIFINADYSQFELRLAAVMANDEALINDFNNNIDVHSKTASLLYGIPESEISSSQRRNAKVVNFGILYGMSPHGLVEATGMGFNEAKLFIDRYMDLRKKVKVFLDKTVDFASENGYVETFFGRKKLTPDINSDNFMIRESARRAAANMPIQGTEADLMKRAMIKLNEELNNNVMQVLQVHDSILVECEEGNKGLVSEQLKNIMENIAPELDVKMKVDIKSGKNWGDV